jgi:hypothetical protein
VSDGVNSISSYVLANLSIQELFGVCRLSEMLAVAVNCNPYLQKNKNKTISEGLHNKTWIKDIDLRHVGFNLPALPGVCQALEHIQSHPATIKHGG